MSTITVTIAGKVINVHANTDEDYFFAQWRAVENGSYEPGVYRAFRERIDSETIVLDLGAYIGYTCLYAAQLSKATYAFEPDPVAFSYLERNCKENPHVANLEIVNKGVGSKAGHFLLSSEANGANAGSSFLLENGKSSWEVEVIDLEEYVSNLDRNGKLFIKIDVEGFEYNMIRKLALISERYHATILLSLHPEVLARTVYGNQLASKIQRRVRLALAHVKIATAFRKTPCKLCLDGCRYPFFEMLVQIFLNGSLEERLKDMVLSYQDKTYS
jgi:FkbM family methyltransferase